jgi:hypothetical protein
MSLSGLLSEERGMFAEEERFTTFSGVLFYKMDLVNEILDSEFRPHCPIQPLSAFLLPDTINLDPIIDLINKKKSTDGFSLSPNAHQL